MFHGWYNFEWEMMMMMGRDEVGASRREIFEGIALALALMDWEITR
jgi:hypothetical protein